MGISQQNIAMMNMGHVTCTSSFEAICFLVLHRASFVKFALDPQTGIDMADSHLSSHQLSFMTVKGCGLRSA